MPQGGQGSLAVSGVGLMTPLGWNAPASCAALRAGISAFAALPEMLDPQGEPISAARLPPIEEADGESRIDRIFDAVVAEALRPFGEEETGTRPIHLFVLAPERDRPGDGAGLAHWIGRARQDPRLGAAACLSVHPGGNAAGIVALRAFREVLARAPTAIGLFWSIDSLLHRETLAYLSRTGCLKGSNEPRGLVPGEAAGCIAVESAAMARRWNRDALARIEGIGVAAEPGTIDSDAPCLGEGLTAAIATALGEAGWRGTEVADVYADLTGETWRAHEWILASCRILGAVDVVHPADCVGDVGAAAAPLLLSLASTALACGHAGSGRILAFCISRGAARGAVCLARG
jgi:3-oxoacyl-[acyl-carrier-protein] synthase-1